MRSNLAMNLGPLSPDQIRIPSNFECGRWCFGLARSRPIGTQIEEHSEARRRLSARGKCIQARRL